MEEKKTRAAMRNQANNHEEDLFFMDRHFTEGDCSLADNVLEASDVIMDEIDSFNDPELSQAMRQTLRTLAAG